MPNQAHALVHVGAAAYEVLEFTKHEMHQHTVDWNGKRYRVRDLLLAWCSSVDMVICSTLLSRASWD